VSSVIGKHLNILPVAEQLFEKVGRESFLLSALPYVPSMELVQITGVSRHEVLRKTILHRIGCLGKREIEPP
jgi:hypothetical protein